MSTFTQGCFLPRFVKLCLVVLEKNIFKFLRFIYTFSLLYLPFEKGVLLHMNKHPLHPILMMRCAKFGWDCPMVLRKKISTFVNVFSLWRCPSFKKIIISGKELLNFDLYLAIMAIEQWEVFSVSHLHLHGASVYDARLQGPLTQTSVAERLAMERSLPVFSIYVCRSLDSNIQPSACEANALTDCATSAVILE